MGLILALVLAAGLNTQSLSIHEEDQRRFGDALIEVPASIAQPSHKSGSRISSSSWQVHGYYPYWASQDDQIPWRALSHLIYFSLELNADGSLGDEHQWLSRGQALVDEGHRHGVKVLPCVTMFDDEAIRTFLASNVARSAAIETLVSRVTETGADGINLDFEFVPASNGESPSPKENFVTFVEDLKSALVAVNPQWELSLATPAVDWSGTYDYDALAEASDGLLIMGYGYHWAGGAPGPISPIDAGTTWGSRSLTWTLDDYDNYGLVENRPKFILGLPLYGRQWPTIDSTVPGTERSSGAAVSLSSCDDAFQVGKVWDEDSSTPYKVFEEAGGWEQLFCEDLASLAAKYTLVEERGLGGLMFWDVSKISGDHPAWSELLDTFGTAPEPEPEDPTDPSTATDPVDPADPSESSSQDESSDPSQGSSPVIVLTAPEAVEVGQVITLDASQSYDVDGDALSFDWSLESGSVIEWRSETTDSVVSLQLGEVGVYRVRVEVSDGQSVSRATVEIAALATPPTTADEGGCSQASPSTLLGLLFAGVQFATRRRRTYKVVRATRR